MSADALRKLTNAVKKGSFDPAYYVCGEDEFQKEDAVKQLLEAAVEPGMRDFNVEIRRAPEMDARTLDAALSALPMLADRRVLVLTEAGALRKDPRKVLDRYLSSPAADVLLILVETAGAKSDKDFTKKATELNFPPLTPDRIPKWIAHQASSVFGTRITPEAIELLQSAVGTDLHQLVSELDKLTSFAQGSEITEADVSAVVGVRRGETMADLLEAVAIRNASRSIELLPRVLSQPKTTGVGLVMALSTQVLALAWGKARMAEGLSYGRLKDEYFNVFLKGGGAPFTGMPWGVAVSVWMRAVERWSARSLDRALAALLAADLALKETRASSEEQVLATLVFSMCVEDDREMAA